MKRRIAIVASHPIQYHSHWYRELARRPELDVEVLYCHRASAADQAEAGFGVAFEWDAPLLEGYRYRFLHNASSRPGVTEFGGTDSPELRGIVIHERYDAVVVSGWHTKSYWQAIRACRQSGTPVMVRSDSHLRDERSGFRQFLKYLPYRYFIPRFEACLAAGAWSRDYFLHYGARPERVFIVPHSVLAAAAPQSERGNPRAHWGIPDSATLFLFAGKLIPRKRPLDFIRAVAGAAAAGSPVRGLLVGDGPLRTEVEALIAQLGAPVTLAGFLNQREIADAYRAADILVLPSDQDTWGLVVNEAMTHGRGCIVSDRVGCGPDLIEPGRTGFVFPVGDVDALSGYMRRIADDPPLVAHMGSAARELIAAHSAQAAADALHRAINAIVPVGKGGA